MYKLYFEISSDYGIWRIMLLRNYSQSKESVENEKKLSHYTPWRRLGKENV
jgi:hypothetical protein